MGMFLQPAGYYTREPDGSGPRVRPRLKPEQTRWSKAENARWKLAVRGKGGAFAHPTKGYRRG